MTLAARDEIKYEYGGKPFFILKLCTRHNEPYSAKKSNHSPSNNRAPSLSLCDAFFMRKTGFCHENRTAFHPSLKATTMGVIYTIKIGARREISGVAKNLPILRFDSENQ